MIIRNVLRLSSARRLSRIGNQQQYRSQYSGPPRLYEIPKIKKEELSYRALGFTVPPTLFILLPSSGQNLYPKHE
jgi:hypothetical protein